MNREQVQSELERWPSLLPFCSARLVAGSGEKEVAEEAAGGLQL